MVDQLWSTSLRYSVGDYFDYCASMNVMGGSSDVTLFPMMIDDVLGLNSDKKYNLMG